MPLNCVKGLSDVQGEKGKLFKPLWGVWPSVTEATDALYGGETALAWHKTMLLSLNIVHQEVTVSLVPKFVESPKYQWGDADHSQVLRLNRPYLFL